MTAPINPIPLGNTAGYIPPAILATYSDFYSINPDLQGLDTAFIYIDPGGNITHLSGPGAGREGVTLGLQLQGEQHMPFEQVLTEGAYQRGATIDRQNYPKKLINLRVVIGGENFTHYQYRMCDNRWWGGQDETRDGWLGVFTRFTGWRWIPVRPYKTVDTAQQMSEHAYGNNMATWDINWICQRPYYSKPTLWGTWYANQSGQPNKQGLYTGAIQLANRGDLPTSVAYMLVGAGVATVQDNKSTTMVQLPPIATADGPCLCDTDPANRTLTASNDPINNPFFDWLASSKILNFFLTNLTSTAEAWWKRGYVRFLYTVPPQTSVTFNVTHTNPNAVITAVLPQKFKRSR
jgi:hypothetical protein